MPLLNKRGHCFHLQDLTKKLRNGWVSWKQVSGEVVGDAGKYVLCTLNTCMKIAFHTLYNKKLIKIKFQKKWVYKLSPAGLWFNTCFKYMILTQTASISLAIHTRSICKTEIKSSVMQKIEKFETVLSLWFRHCCFSVHGDDWLEVRLPAWLFEGCVRCWEAHVQKQVYCDDWLATSLAWPWPSSFS